MTTDVPLFDEVAEARRRQCTLSPRQLEIVALLAEGLTLEQVGKRLYVTLATVRTHVRLAFEKTDTHGQTELVALALRSAWIK